MFHVSLAFFGQYRPAHFEGLTLRYALARAERALTRAANRPKLLDWLHDAQTSISAGRSTHTTISHGALCVTVAAGPHDPWLDDITDTLPDYPGLDYGEAVNAKATERFCAEQSAWMEDDANRAPWPGVGAILP